MPNAREVTVISKPLARRVEHLTDNGVPQTLTLELGIDFGAAGFSNARSAISHEASKYRHACATPSVVELKPGNAPLRTGRFGRPPWLSLSSETHLPKTMTW